MGGNYYKLGRVVRSRYLEIEAELREFFDKHIPGLYQIPRYYESKSDFGDVDVILSREALASAELNKSDDFVHELKKLLQELGIECCEKNGNIIEAVFRNVQIDFFVVAPELVESTRSYMDFNDLGNMIGRMFRPFRLKYRDTGLFYVFWRSNRSYKREILVSRDWEKVLRFVGLDYTAWEQGFKTPEEMFEWVVASPYFRAEPYLDPNSPARKVKRLMGKKFIEFVEQRHLGHPFPDTFMNSMGDEEHIVSLIYEYFPESGLLAKISKEHMLEVEAQSVAKKFNGRVVMDLVPGLRGQELGNFLHNFREDITSESLLAMSTEEIQTEIMRRLP